MAKQASPMDAMQRLQYLILLPALLVVATACSQRSPRRVVTSLPTRVPATSRARPAEVVSAGAPALSTVAAAPADATLVAEVGSLYFPVSGMENSPLDDSFHDARDGGARKHHAIDIMAPRGTPVLSVQDGRVLRLSTSDKGGITIYATNLEERFVFYYAHLERYHQNMYAGRPVMRGDTIGFVGTSGNAPKTVPHLHFQMMRMPADGKYWNGEAINPYPLLRQTTSASTGR